MVEIHGDRAFADDEAIFAGLATIDGHRVAVLGHRKGPTRSPTSGATSARPHPEGYRKAMRVMRLADKFGLPIVTFLDTAGAYPGIEAEERGQALAIAESLALLSGVRVPVVVVGIGEGGSGGALAIGFGDRMLMLENAYYSVISPEMCSNILYKDPTQAEDGRVVSEDGPLRTCWSSASWTRSCPSRSEARTQTRRRPSRRWGLRSCGRSTSFRVSTAIGR